MTHEIQARLERLPLHPEGQPALQHLTPHLLSALSVSASPDRALINFERFLAATPDPAGVLEALSEDPRTVDALVAVFAGSQYLTEILLRNPPWVSLLSMHSGIARIKTAACLATETRQVVAPWRTGAGESHREALDALRRFQQRELLRIGAADLAGLVELASVTSQLSLLADAIIQATLEIVAVSANVAAAGFAVLAMGKLGGNELNYSSDVDLLFLARPRQLTFAQVPLAEVFDEVHTLMSMDVAAKNGRLEQRMTAQTVLADRDALKQAVINLLMNSVEALPEEGGLIEFATEADDRGTWLRIRDNGRGMTEEEREHALEPFYTTRDKGTGLGLAIVHTIMQEHGGSIRIETRPTAGTVVSLFFPANHNESSS